VDKKKLLFSIAKILNTYLKMSDIVSKKTPDMDVSWLKVLGTEFEKSYMSDLRDFLKKEKSLNKIIFPPTHKTFRCLKLTSLESVKVVIIGQDPYHGIEQANGLAFSVENSTPIPPSLKNIYKEIKTDLSEEPPLNGDLSFWASQGVLLLNSVLTVEMANPASHAEKGWEIFTDRIIQILNLKENIVFMLWGSYAQKKGSIINDKKHKILEAPHPSPLSAHRGFFGCKHFSKANEYLKKIGKSKILWTPESSSY
tara:strand:- start:8954 stop:9715 length:762 start_codon:yes stop_codon:yes gene_type:complete